MSTFVIIFFAVVLAMKWADAVDYQRRLKRANETIDDRNKRIDFLQTKLEELRKATP